MGVTILLFLEFKKDIGFEFEIPLPKFLDKLLDWFLFLSLEYFLLILYSKLILFFS